MARSSGSVDAPAIPQTSSPARESAVTSSAREASESARDLRCPAPRPSRASTALTPPSKPRPRPGSPWGSGCTRVDSTTGATPVARCTSSRSTAGRNISSQRFMVASRVCPRRSSASPSRGTSLESPSRVRSRQVRWVARERAEESAPSLTASRWSRSLVVQLSR
nr:hypothetical protein [Deltaproteobacteria bacterium]